VTPLLGPPWPAATALRPSASVLTPSKHGRWAALPGEIPMARPQFLGRNWGPQERGDHEAVGPCQPSPDKSSLDQGARRAHSQCVRSDKFFSKPSGHTEETTANGRSHPHLPRHARLHAPPNSAGVGRLHTLLFTEPTSVHRQPSVAWDGALSDS
jgi:hypothetical protein